MAKIIDGKQIAKELNEKTSDEVKKLLVKDNIVPGLVVIIVGDDEASHRYVRNKHRTAQKLGINSIVDSQPATISENELIDLINKYNNDDQINGILVQDPLPSGIDEKKITKAIDPKKDVDGFHPLNVGKLFLDDSTNYPVACTPKGIITMLDYYHIDIKGKNAVVIGRSAIVGKPMGALLLNRGASTTIIHRYTKDIYEYTRNADIVVSATGQVHLLGQDAFKKGAVIIDVGQNRDENGHLVGDVDFEDASNQASYITPVPGGVGPMTIATLMQQTVELTKWSKENGE